MFRWKGELHVEVKRWQEKIQQLEKEKSDAQQSWQKKLDALEVTKVDDIDRLKTMYM